MSDLDLGRRELLKLAAASGVAFLAWPERVRAAESHLVAALQADPVSLNANFNQTQPAFPIYGALFDRLVQADSTKQGRMKPMLATSWRQVNPTTWQFKLRQGVKFHNGEAFDASAVKATFERLLAQRPPSVPAARNGLVAGVEVVDAQTVNIVTKQPWATALVGITEVAMLPPKVLAEKGDEGLAQQPVGTGPYRFVEWRKGQSITLEANRDYWGPAKARIDQLVFRSITDDNTRLAALEAGEVDVAVNFPPDETDHFRGKGFQVQSVAIGQGMFVFMRPVPGTPLEKKEVRQALNYAVDKESLVKNVLRGLAPALKGQVLGPDGFGYNPKLEAYPYNPAKAKQLLAQAGYPNGFKIAFDSSANRYLKQKEMSEAIVGQLAKVGVTAELQIYEWGKIVDKLTKTLDLSPLFFLGWNYSPAMDADAAMQHLRSVDPKKLWASPALDDLIARERAEFDPTKRLRVLQDLAAQVREEAPLLFLYQAVDVYGVAKRVKGFMPLPDTYWDVTAMSVE